MAEGAFHLMFTSIICPCLTFNKQQG